VIRVLHHRAERLIPRRATVLLSSAELSPPGKVPDVKWTGLENAREAKEKLRQKKLLAKKRPAQFCSRSPFRPRGPAGARPQTLGPLTRFGRKYD
jgi:hypothetical protein